MRPRPDAVHLAEVAVPLPLFHPLTYTLPPELFSRAQPGCRALVPVGRRLLTGYIVGLPERSERAGLKDVVDILDEGPLLRPDLLELCRWVADYYIAPLGQVLRGVLPAGLARESQVRLSLAEGLGARAMPVEGLSPVQRAVLGALVARSPQTVGQVRRSLGRAGHRGALLHAVAALERRGLIQSERVLAPGRVAARKVHVVRVAEEAALPESERARLFRRARRQRECLEWLEGVGRPVELAHLTEHLQFPRSAIEGLEKRGLVVIEEQEVLRDPLAQIEATAEGWDQLAPTPEQEAAIRRILGPLRDRRMETFLLHGVTSSGKTLVYLEVLREALAQRRSGILLVPEIALTPQTVGRVRQVFGDAVALYHSALSEGERYDAWRRAREGSARILVGARSAVFAPFEEIGAIVIDEEHETTYKQAETPRYHARDVALMRARRHGAVVVLGSATPSLESYRLAREGRITLLPLSTRVGERPLPPVRVVDLKGLGGGGAPAILSPALREAIEAHLARTEQVLLLLNRRGFSPFVQCLACGAVLPCPSCSISLTLHRHPPRLVCHYCGWTEEVPDTCPACSGRELLYKGIGTERVEREMQALFPEARVARMDLDTTSGKWSHHRILEEVRAGRTDILLGTQMVAKGLDFPNVTLVGVISADTGIHLPDFRAGERTFQLLAQVAGRTGRGEKGGEVILQTYLPNHPVILAAAQHDYASFAEAEMAARAEANYPPYCRLVNFLVSGEEEKKVVASAEGAAAFLRGLLRSQGLEGTLRMVGPAPCAISRIQRRYRWHILLKGTEGPLLQRAARYLVEKEEAFLVSGVRLAVDRDPLSLL